MTINNCIKQLENNKNVDRIYLYLINCKNVLLLTAEIIAILSSLSKKTIITIFN